MSRLCRAAAHVALLLSFVSVSVAAQCPDGTPPPCRGATPLRRVVPSLNPKGWIVVPFTNAMKTPELDWLRDASVNLLTLDMGRWTDVSVVPDKRVADLLRELSPARASQALALSDGLTLARRAGAGRLVMGDFFGVGTGARFVANVFDVATGAKLRSVTQQAPVKDSLLGAFGPLARSVLAVPPPADAKTGDVGTVRLDAYQAYLRGVRERNRMRLPESEKEFREALRLDSTFALAHAGLANVLAWEEIGASNTERLPHALAAQRFGTTLPPRERTLIGASVAYARRELGLMCDVVAPLVRADSTDVEALYLLATCNLNDQVDRLPNGGMSFHGSWNLALTAARSILRLDPSFYPAFDRVGDVLFQWHRVGCAEWTQGEAGRRCKSPVDVAVLWDGDSLVTPVKPNLASEALLRPAAERSLSLARAIAQEWLANDPAGAAPREALTESLMRLGRNDAAYQALHKGPIPVTAFNQRGLMQAIELAIKVGKGAEARGWLDSLTRVAPDTKANLYLRAHLDLPFARGDRFLRFVESQEEAAIATNGVDRAAVARYNPYIARTLLRLPSPGLAAAESLLIVSFRPSCNRQCRGSFLLGGSPNEPRTWVPDTSVLAGGDLLRLIVARDTARLRALARETDSTAMAHVFFNAPFQRAQAAYLALGDTAAALRVTRVYVDSAAMYGRFVSRALGIGQPAMMVGMMRQRGELAAALGLREEALTWIDRVLDLWADASPEFQPDVARLRALRAKVAGRQ